MTPRLENKEEEEGMSETTRDKLEMFDKEGARYELRSALSAIEEANALMLSNPDDPEDADYRLGEAHIAIEAVLKDYFDPTPTP